ncbi:MAG: DnaJ domain-containing protein [Pseudomonadota bacterium]
MADDDNFIDYYNILQVDWYCDSRGLERAYRELAKLYHPDHPETADVNKLNEVLEAYRALRDPNARAKYDVRHAINTVRRPRPDPQSEIEVEERAAISDAEVHESILRLLYKRRRENARNAGVGQYFVQEMLRCSDEVFDFHIWYLKAKGFVESTEDGTFAITIEGVDHVIATSRTKSAEKLRIAQATI